MAGYNRIIIVGNLTREPDYKQLTSGQAVCRLSLATNRQFKNRQTGAMVQEVCYIDIDVWGAQAESCRQFLQKGRSVLIEGRLKFDQWDAEGQKRSKHSIVADRVVFLGSGAQAEDSEVEDIGFAGGNLGGGARISREMQSQPQPTGMEKDLFDQIDRLKAKAAPKTAKKPQAATQFSAGGEIDFKDQPPFEDDLPF